MNWTDKIYTYCERGIDASFWGEPLNATSNAAFWIAALAGFLALWRQGYSIGGRIPELLLCCLVAVIGTGSFLFHTFATPWAAVADVLPIGVFMFAYVAYAVRRFLGANVLLTLLALGAFIAALYLARTMACPPILADIVSASRGRCLNGTFAYVPAFLALIIIAVTLCVLQHRAWTWLLVASGVFFVSMVFRTFDQEWCQQLQFRGYTTGTHFLWHILNAATLYLLLMAAIHTGRDKATKNPPGVHRTG